EYKRIRSTAIPSYRFPGIGRTSRSRAGMGRKEGIPIGGLSPWCPQVVKAKDFMVWSDASTKFL
ncbi:MAG: hypothetical protein H6R30_559, partial [Methanomicrobia archaeon]|nr:hypothetical protein [Methanomicrobia archaeon]